MKPSKDELYERCVAAWANEEFDRIEATITANAKIRGVVSRRLRQIDVLVEDRTADPPHARIVIDAKLHGRKLDVAEVEAFEGKLRDVEASCGVLVASRGFTSSAMKRADEAIIVTLLSYGHSRKRFSRKASSAGESHFEVTRVPSMSRLGLVGVVFPR